jgi:hypothetical protein
MFWANPDQFDFLSNFSTLWAVFLGAILATIGGFTATQLEWFFERRRRERNSALFFGEVLSTLAIVLKYAESSRKIGDPYGPITVRFLRSARREIEIYDRNRESLFDLRDADIRARIHTLILRLTMPLDGIFDATQELQTLQSQVKSPLLAPEDRKEIEDRIATITSSRDTSFDFVSETGEQLRTAMKQLEPLARHSFDGIEEVVRNT